MENYVQFHPKTKARLFLKQVCARSSVDSKQGTSTVVSLIGFVKVSCLESTEDRVLIMNGLSLNED